MTTTEVCLACGAGADGRTHECDCDAKDAADFEALVEDVVSECPLCGGEPIVLGPLGRLIHCRCRRCGIDFSFRTGA